MTEGNICLDHSWLGHSVIDIGDRPCPYCRIEELEGGDSHYEAREAALKRRLQDINTQYCNDLEEACLRIAELEDVIWHLRKEVRITRAEVLSEVLASIKLYAVRRR